MNMNVIFLIHLFIDSLFYTEWVELLISLFILQLALHYRHLMNSQYLSVYGCAWMRLWIAILPRIKERSEWNEWKFTCIFLYDKCSIFLSRIPRWTQFSDERSNLCASTSTHDDDVIVIKYFLCLYNIFTCMNHHPSSEPRNSLGKSCIRLLQCWKLSSSSIVDNCG